MCRLFSYFAVNVQVSDEYVTTYFKYDDLNHNALLAFKG